MLMWWYQQSRMRHRLLYVLYVQQRSILVQRNNEGARIDYAWPC